MVIVFLMELLTEASCFARVKGAGTQAKLKKKKCIKNACSWLTRSYVLKFSILLINQEEKMFNCIDLNKNTISFLECTLFTTTETVGLTKRRHETERTTE